MSWDGELEVDFDRFEYEEIKTLNGDTYWVKVACRHRNVETVRHLLTGHEVARLCADCDTQLPVSKGVEW